MALMNPRYKQPRVLYGVNNELQKFPRQLRYRCDWHNSTIGKVLDERGWQQVEGDSDSWDFYWCEVMNIPTIFEKPFKHNQIVTHFRNHYELTKKSLLARNIGRYKRQLLKEGRENEAKLCDCIPTTFELPIDYIIFENYYKKNPGNIYIVKPAFGCKGYRIFIFKKLKELNDWKSSRNWLPPYNQLEDRENLPEEIDKEIGNIPQEWVIQVYIQNPYLMNGKKFDIRFFVLVESFVPMIVWIARDAFARFCGKDFNLDQLKDNYCHLTNSSIQLGKHAEVPGFKWPFLRLRQYLTAKHGAEIFETLLQNIANLILTSVRAVQKTIAHNKHCVEMYGYDVIIDADLRPWLLEINASPSLDPTDFEDYRMKRNLLIDFMNIIDFEGQRTGNEIRVGGYDLLWNDGPVYKPCPNETETGPLFAGKRNLNINLGAYNDRQEQLRDLQAWKNINEQKQEMKHKI